MRRLLLLMLLIPGCVLASVPDYLAIPLTTYQGDQQVSLSTLNNGKPTYLKFWASWCKPCMAQMPHFEHAYQEYRNDLNVIAVNININETRENIAATVQRFGLTIPIWLDNEGALGVALGLIGTPYHVLLDAKGQILFTTHEADAELDTQLQLLAKGTLAPMPDAPGLNAKQQADLLAPAMQGTQLVFFTATWCDWYLADTRPEMAANCDAQQKQLKQLIAQTPQMPWKLMVNHLWTAQTDVDEFISKYQPGAAVLIDEQGVWFKHFSIRDIPTLLLLENGKVVKRWTTLPDAKQLSSLLK